MSLIPIRRLVPNNRFQDDEGVDLVGGNRLNDKSLLLQIKSRFALSGRGRYRANVRRATCSPNPKKFLLFVYYDKEKAARGECCWLVSASEFCQRLANQRNTRPVYVFDSGFTSKGDMWAPSGLSTKDVAAKILKVLS